MSDKPTPTDHKPETDPESQPWAKQFDDDRDASGNLSRVATRHKKRGNSTLTWIVWIALAIIIIVPVAYNAWASNRPANNDYTSSKITVNTSKQKASKAKAKSKSVAASEAAASSKATASSKAAAKKSATSTSSSTPARSSSQASSSASSSAKSSAATNTYTVKAGDNLYRIAVNHGMSLAEIESLNGLSSSTISVGQTLKVK